MFGWVLSCLIPSPNPPPWQSLVSNAFISVLRGAWRILDGVLCLAEFQFVWYLHQLLQREGITHDNFMSPIAVFLMLQDALRLFVWLRSIPFDTFIKPCCVKVSPMTILWVKSRSYWCFWMHRTYSTAVCCQRCSTLHYITLHCIALHCTTLHYIALHYITLHCITLHCITLNCIPLHCIALHYITLHYITLHYITLHCTAFHCIALHYIALHCIALHYIALQCITLHCIALHSIALH